MAPKMLLLSRTPFARPAALRASAAKTNPEQTQTGEKGKMETTRTAGNKSRGFTIVELLMIIAIIGIASAIAVPNIVAWRGNVNLGNATRDVYGNLTTARMTAIRRNVTCTVAFNQTVSGITYDYAVFVDADEDLEYDAGEETVLLADMGAYGNVAFDATKGGGDGISFSVNDAGLPAVAFPPSGLPLNNAGGMGSGTVFLVSSTGKTTSITVSATGNIRID